jgi:hypothetical protein
MPTSTSTESDDDPLNPVFNNDEFFTDDEESRALWSLTISN